MNRHRIQIAGLVVAVTLVVGGCGASSSNGDGLETVAPIDTTATTTTGSPATTTPTTSTPSTTSVETTTTTVAVDLQGEPLDQSTLKLAIADLANRLEVDSASITVVAYEAVIWNDGSLGCPQPGMSYTQALVDGYLIVLESGGVEYRYHGADGRDPFLCELPVPDQSTGGTGSEDS